MTPSPRALALIAVCVLGTVGCAPDPVRVEVIFPSEETFLVTQLVRIRAFEADPNDLGLCPTLVNEVVTGTPREAVINGPPLRACTVREGGFSVEDVPPGPLAWVATAETVSTRLLAGCTVAEVYADAPTIDIDLFMTSDYPVGATPMCLSVEDKCVRGCGR